MTYIIEDFKSVDSTGESYRVLVVKLTSPLQILEEVDNSIHQIIEDNHLSNSVGLYFYRYKKLDETGFTKIGEVSNSRGVIHRKRRGWLLAESNGDTYKRGKVIHTDILRVSESNPMYFVFYESAVENSFPKIDENYAFFRHKNQFHRSTRNEERVNSFHDLGSNLRWYPDAFNEVLNLKLPSGRNYP